MRNDIGVQSKSLHPGQLVVDSLACDHGQMNATSLEGWFQEYVQKRAAMGVAVNFKEASATVTLIVEANF